MQGPARSLEFWRPVWWALLLGVFAGVFSLGYLWLERLGFQLLWPEEPPTGWFSGEWWWILIPTGAGVVVGTLYQVFHLPARLPGFVEELEEGRVEWRHAPGAVIVALVSLIGGASLGPEAPLGTGSGGAGSWLAERRGADAAGTATATFAGMSGAFGGLLSSPLVGTLFGLELEHTHDRDFFFHRLVPGIVSGLVAFAIVYPILGPVFVGRYDFPSFEPKTWNLLAGLAMGIVGAGAAVLLGFVGKVAGSVFARFDASPVLRGGIGGFLLGIFAFVLPLTMSSGAVSLQVVIDESAEIGLAFLLVLVLAKAVTLGVSIGSGFYGGQFFPIFFMGGTLGAAVHVIVPELPIALAVGCMLAAVAAALAPIPLSVTFIAILLLGVSTPTTASIAAASITAYVITHGFGIIGSRSPRVDQQEGPA